jgi:hypothetical protein
VFINPLTDAGLNVEWENLKRAAQDRLLNKEVNFQGDMLPLRRLMETNSAVELLNRETLVLLAQNESNVRIGRPLTYAIDYVPDSYAPRIIQWPRV